MAGEPGNAVMDIGGWLRMLGLEQYEAAFRENNVDGAILALGDRADMVPPFLSNCSRVTFQNE
jgi:hypothetical protein